MLQDGHRAFSNRYIYAYDPDAIMTSYCAAGPSRRAVGCHLRHVLHHLVPGGLSNRRD